MEPSLMIILIGISGSGKSTLRDYVLNQNVQFKKLIAVTDRPPRLTEQDGVDKFFMNSQRFQELQDAGNLCFINEIYNFKYAFRKCDFNSGGIFLGELHYKSLAKFIDFHPNSISIYIKPQNMNFAVQGLSSRGAAQEEIIIRKNALLYETQEIEDMNMQNCFNYSFINEYNERSKLQFYELLNSIIQENKDGFRGYH